MSGRTGVSIKFSRKRARALPCCRSAAGEAADHEADHCPADHGFGAGLAGLVVPGEAAVGGGTREGALDRPAFGLDLEAALARILRTMSNSRPSIWVVQSTRRTAKPWSQIFPRRSPISPALGSGFRPSASRTLPQNCQYTVGQGGKSFGSCRQAH